MFHTTTKAQNVKTTMGLTRNIQESIRDRTKRIVENIGLEFLAKKIYRFLITYKYRYKKYYKLSLDNKEIFYSTEDSYSRQWFFPRCSDGKMHEEKVTRCFLDQVSRSECIVDIGAHIGWFTCLAGEFAPNARVLSFEMDREAVAILERNISINGLDNVNVYNMAVSDENGTIQFGRRETKPNPGFQILKNPSSNRGRELIRIESTTLDSFFDDKELIPDLVKIDVEGAEMKVLKGMSHLISVNKPGLVIEIHPNKLAYYESSSSQLVEYLRTRGYALSIVDGHGDQSNSSLDSGLDHKTTILAI